MVLHRALHRQAGSLTLLPFFWFSRRARRARVVGASSAGRQFLVRLRHRNVLDDGAVAPDLPKTSRSSSEFVPRRLAPCTEAQAHSPAA